MADIEVLLTDLGEITAGDIAKKENLKGLKENLKVTKRGGEVSKSTRKHYERETGNIAITEENTIGTKYLKS